MKLAYLVGNVPLTDPCIECFLKESCSATCMPKSLHERNRIRNANITPKINIKRKKKKRK